jgi:hypothetical protein
MTRQYGDELGAYNLDVKLFQVRQNFDTKTQFGFIKFRQIECSTYDNAGCLGI